MPRYAGRRSLKKNTRHWSDRELKTVYYPNHSCPLQKTVYPTRRDAKRVARIIASSGGILMRPEECNKCGLIHLFKGTQSD